MNERVLVIKLGALGDFVQAFGPFAAIRAHHQDARITLLTTRPFAALAEASPWFDEIWQDDKPKLWQPLGLLALARRLRSGGFARVYDLQTSDRSSSYFRLIGKGPEWSGIARGCSHPHANPARDFMHTQDRQAEQLCMAGIARVPPPDLSWATTDCARFGLAAPYALLCPGGASHRPAKRWPAGNYARLALRLVLAGTRPVLIGGADETAPIAIACPEALDLGGRTGHLDILGLARGAALAVGNDTGPMHLIAAAGCPGLVLFSAESDPALCAPRGDIRVLRRDDLARLTEDEVAGRAGLA